MFNEWRWNLLKKVSKKLRDGNGILIDKMLRNIGNDITFNMLHKRVTARQRLVDLIQKEQGRLLEIRLNKILK